MFGGKKYFSALATEIHIEENMQLGRGIIFAKCLPSL